MGLRDEIQADIAEAFNEDLADAVHSFTCEQYEIQTLGVLATDKKATLLQNEVSMTPKIDDEWLTALGSFRVIHIQQDPASTIWKCQLRKV
ncbi:glutamate 5-kinase [Acinetobacter baumannii]|uniref:glutamate 5-kinase n=1 Tax=Acinetobacter baumannii TaxID=470 RepID=UPI000E5C7AA9|nr:glutamate 5-kinase [Acinetobacter baumannii]